MEIEEGARRPRGFLRERSGRVAKGKKADEQTLEVARALLAARVPVAEVSRKLKVPESTVRGWRKRFEAEDAEAREAQNNAQNSGGGKELLSYYTSENFAELRAQKKREMIERAWRIIEKAQAKVERELDRAIEREGQIDEALFLLGTMGENLSVAEQKRCFKVLSEMQMSDIGKLSTVMGTMYDKQALAIGEETEILGGSVTVRRFEDL